MCLLTNQAEPLKAEEDITCYKILLKINGNLITPYQSTCVNVTEPLVAEGNDKTFLEYIENHESFYRVEKGFIHTYAKFEYAKHDEPIFAEGPKVIIFECVIPKGTYYYKGRHFGLSGYASKEIKIVKEI